MLDMQITSPSLSSVRRVANMVLFGLALFFGQIADNVGEKMTNETEDSR